LLYPLLTSLFKISNDSATVHSAAAFVTSLYRRIAAFIAVSDCSIAISDKFGFCIEVSQASGQKEAVLWN